MNELENTNQEAGTAADLSTIYAQFLSTLNMSDALSSQLHEWMAHHKEALNISDYVHILYMEGVRYEQLNNKNAARYCAMRMLYVKERIRYPRKKRSRMLLFEPFAFHEDEEAFIERYTDFIQGVYRSIDKKLLMLTAGLMLFVFVIVALLLKVHPILALVEAFVLGLINLLIQKRKMPEIFQKNQTDASGKHIEETLRSFDAVYRYL